MTSFAINLKRLMAWHGLQGKDLARALATDGKTVSAWTNAKYDPSLRMLLALDYLFATDRPRELLEGDPDDFGQTIADPRRRRLADERIAAVIENPSSLPEAADLDDEVGRVIRLHQDEQET